VSDWVYVAGIAAAFVLLLVLGLKFLAVYSGKTRQGAHATQSAAASADTMEYVRIAEADAESIRQRAEQDAQAMRRSVETELDALRRAAQTESESARSHSASVRERAESAAADLLADAARAAERETASRLAAVENAEIDLQERLRAAAVREAEIDSQVKALTARQNELESAEVGLAQLRDELASARALQDAERVSALERVAGLTTEEAKVELMASVETIARREAAALVRTIEAEARTEGTDRARSIVVEAVQRVASEQTTETVVSVLHLPSDEMKGRIIGREGRNIRAFESVTGVNVIIDDTPEAVLLSCFDPVRREVGRITLEKLVLDGRIHPHRIEEVYESAKDEVDELCLRAARDALADVGITDLDERLIPTLGRLKYRTSYGQNVLGHLVETAHIAGVMASELGLEPALIKRCAFLHDIGKALTHEVEGSHAIIGADLIRRFGESDAVAHAVEAHHNEVQPRTIEAVLTQAADACSAARPGARRESLETYIKRLERIEEIASAKHGVDKVFAMQSGREVRVMVQPNEVDDLAAGVIAREVAKQIEDELTYPGQIRVTVVRESRATEVAH